MKIVQWKAYDFVLNEELDTYSIASRHTTYSLKRDLTASTLIDLASAAADESHEVTSKSITENKVNKVKVSLGEEEMFLREEAEHLMVGLSDMPVSDHEVAMEDSFSPTSPDLIIKPVEESQSTACVPIRNPYMLKFLVKVEPVIKNNWLGTSIVNLAMKILKLNHPAIGGFYCSILGGSLEFPGATGQQWLQIVHDGANHCQPVRPLTTHGETNVWLISLDTHQIGEQFLVANVVGIRQQQLRRPTIIAG
ncbi:hypothetical protein OUZ56_029568 [Daphnia magna]|uniref:Uncharacterized protein n=1 Tax=Daphnia magna TaxID=35525 RepID=A0ABR0B776_9CRUS|nr:hypothetical protein OUZ56_029568 [Daphnia magna]